MISDYQPTIARFMEAVADTKKRAHSPELGRSRRRTAEELHTELILAKKGLTTNLEKADRYFTKYGGWGSAEPDPKPTGWDDKTNTYKEWLSDYETVCSAIRVGTAVLWEVT